MKKLVGINFIESKKGSSYAILHLVDDDVFDTVNHDNLFDSPAKSAWGQSVSTEFLALDDVHDGLVDIVGDLVPGCGVRIFKESINGMDRISLIKVIPKDTAFVNGSGGFGDASDKGKVTKGK